MVKLVVKRKWISDIVEKLTVTHVQDKNSPFVEAFRRVWQELLVTVQQSKLGHIKLKTNKKVTDIDKNNIKPNKDIKVVFNDP